MRRSRRASNPFSARFLLPLLCAALLASSCDPRTQILRLGHGLDQSHPVHRAMEFMASDLAERSGGSLRVEVFPSEQLGSERELLELLQIGSVDMTKVSASVLESFAPEFRLLGLPYLFADAEHQWRVLEGPVGETLLAAPARVRLRGLCFYDAGARSFYSQQRPILHPDDLEGLKIRTQESPSAVAMVRALGGNATPISWGELYTALQQGVVDGAENNPPSFHLSRHYEVARYYALDEHTAVPDVLLVSEKLWQRLDEQERNLVLESARASSELQRELWKVATAEALEAVREAGVEIHSVEKAPFRERVTSLRQAFVDDPSTSHLASLLEEIDASRPATPQSPSP